MSGQRGGNGDLGLDCGVLLRERAVGLPPMQVMVHGSGFKGARAQQQRPAAPMDRGVGS